MVDAANSVTPVPKAPVITRNEVSLTLVSDQFGKNSKKPGFKFWTPKLSVSTFTNDMSWVGQLYIVNTLNRIIRKTFAEIAIDNIDEATGKVDYDKWLLEAQSFDEAGATLSDLDEEIDTINGKMQQVVCDPDTAFGQVGADDKPTEAAIEANALVLEYNQQLKALRSKRNEIRTKYQLRIEKKEATQKANAEAVKLATQGGAAVTSPQLVGASK